MHDDPEPTISDRAYVATLKLLQDTSRAPSTSEIAKLVERFALQFGSEVGFKLVSFPQSDGAAFAVRNAVDRAAKGEW
jgi:hypothetical protein